MKANIVFVIISVVFRVCLSFIIGYEKTAGKSELCMMFI
ncbi:DUF6903 family protein [Bacillus paranthracis]